MAKIKAIKTVTQIEALKPNKAARYEVADAKLRGNRLTVFPTGRMSWVHRYRFANRTRKLTLECSPFDLATARELGGAAMKALAAGVDPGIQKQEKKQQAETGTVGKLIDVYYEKHLKKLATGDESKRVLLKELAKYLGRQAEGGITEHEAFAIVASIGDRGLPIRNRSLAWLRGMFDWACDPEHRTGVKTNPFGRMKLKSEGDGRDRVLTPAEIKAVWTATAEQSAPYRDVLRLLLLTGQRLHQISDLKWREVDLENRRITLPTGRTKNRQGHIVHLSDEAVAILQATPKIASKAGYVFTLDGERLNGWTDVRLRLYEATEKALGEKLEDWRPHDFRRTFASLGVDELKLQDRVVDKVLNHSTKRKGVARIYNRSELLDERQHALEVWGAYVGRLVNGSPGSNVVTFAQRA